MNFIHLWGLSIGIFLAFNLSLSSDKAPKNENLSGFAQEPSINRTASTEKGKRKLLDDCNPVTPPFMQDFEGQTPPEIPDCAEVENEGAENNWETYFVDDNGFEGNALRYKVIEANAGSWFFTRGIQLQADTEYMISCRYGYFENFEEGEMELYYGSSPSSPDMSTKLADLGDLYYFGSQNQWYASLIDVPEDGVYYFGFHAFADSQWAIDGAYLLDDIKVEVAPDCPAPTMIYAGNYLNFDNNYPHGGFVTWTPIGNESQWEVLWGEHGFDPETEGQSEIVDYTEYWNEDFVNGEVYDFYVRAICGEDEYSDWTGPYTFVEMSVKEYPFDGIELYPNPVKSTLHLKAHQPPDRVVVYDLRGREIARVDQPRQSHLKIPADNWSPGLYLIRISADHQSRVIRILKK